VGHKPRGKLLLARRREQVADLYLQGNTQVAIAERLQVAQSTICSDLKAIHGLWQQSSIRNFDLAREIELKKLDRVEREAWAVWDRSQKPAQSAKFRGEATPSGGEKTIRNQYGDPRFLEQVNRCIANRRAILGLDAAIPVVPVLPVQPRKVPLLDLPPEERRARLSAIFARIRSAAASVPEPSDGTLLLPGPNP
jgi:hypothetical protein